MTELHDPVDYLEKLEALLTEGLDEEVYLSMAYTDAEPEKIFFQGMVEGLSFQMRHNPQVPVEDTANQILTRLKEERKK